MPYDRELNRILAISNKYAGTKVRPEFSEPAARRIVKRCKTLDRPIPLPVQRFMDRVEPPAEIRDKMGRDLFGKPMSQLTSEQQGTVDAEHSRLISSASGWNPADGHPYYKPGFTFAQMRHILLQTYRVEANYQYTHLPELKAALIDFRDAMETDLDEAAKDHGFYKEYSDANQALRTATSARHRINQSTPLTVGR